MDPITESLKNFQEQVRAFRNNQEKSILSIITESQHVELLSKIIRGEEWQPDNNSPVLIFNTSCLKDEKEVCDSICQIIKEHYSIIKEGYEKENIEIPEFVNRLPDFDEEDEKDVGEIISVYIYTFTTCLKNYLSPPYICWLPTNVRDRSEWEDILEWLFESLKDSGVRFIFSTEKEKYIKRFQKRYEETLSVIEYAVHDEETNDFFGKLFAPPSLGHMQGTPSGSAAPDVEPPPRKTMQIPDDEAARKAMASLNIPPFLTPAQSEQLQSAVFTAARALGKSDEETTIKKQLEACAICEQAGVTLEHAMMRLTLANYYLQFKRNDEAEVEYRKAETLAAEIPAYPQIAQIRMALAFIYMRKRKTREKAAYEYEQAAVAATIGESWLLYLEALRMAGTCHIKLKDTDSALLCWKAAVEKSKDMAKEEVRASSFLDIAGNFIKVLKKNRLFEQAKSVENIVKEIGEQFVV